MVRALACHAGDPGSIPGVGAYFLIFYQSIPIILSQLIKSKQLLIYSNNTCNLQDLKLNSNLLT